ncbi:MAG: nuclear transport factor 2 family protein [Proteobacteria bacterium]|nr:nuclear transport factor 2 family protein [Pseudomonadota bacterium]
MLSKESGLRAYASMINSLDAEKLAPLLADDFTYESQMVFEPIESKKAFLEYIRVKLETIRNSDSPVYAEMGVVHAYFENQPCVILAQGSKEDLVAIVLAKTEGAFLKRLDLCIVPEPHSAKRSNDYPQ